MKITEEVKTLAWTHGLKWALRNGYTMQRDSRIIAMAYELGYVAALRSSPKEEKHDTK